MTLPVAAGLHGRDMRTDREHRQGVEMAQLEKSDLDLGVAFDLNGAVNDAIGACCGDLIATIRSLVVATTSSMALNAALSAELDHVLKVGLAGLLGWVPSWWRRHRVSSATTMRQYSLPKVIAVMKPPPRLRANEGPAPPAPRCSSAQAAFLTAGFCLIALR